MDAGSDKKIKVLLAEDDQFLVKTLKERLEQEGFTVVIALDGGQAMERVNEVKPDIVLLDLMMPVKSGFDVLEEMKANSELKKIPVVILTNLGQESDTRKCLDLGATDYLIKAKIAMKDVVEKIKEHVR